MIEKFLPRTEFDSYEDFKANYKLNIPEDFNFGFDIIDEWARQDPEKPALVWINDNFDEERLTFTDIKERSNQAANFFKAKGIKKGDFVLLILKQRIETWVCMVALHKIGAIVIPGTFQLMPHDIEYRCNKADIKMICTVDEPELLANIESVRPQCRALRHVAVVGEHIPEGFLDFRGEVKAYPKQFPRPSGAEGTNVHDLMLGYFTSGTTGMPKLIVHNYAYPLGHITTANYWHQVRDGGLHLVASDSGWAKFGWGKIYGQWICGAVIVAYDTEGKFDAHHMLTTIEKLRPVTFCAPPTVYRFLIKEDLSGYDLSSIKKATIAGEPLNPEVYNKFKAATGLELTEGFGQSETTVIIANFPWFPIKPGSTGKFSPLYDLDIVDEEGHSCEDGIVGTIVVKNLDKSRPAGLLVEYYREAKANAESFFDNMYSTGDTAWRDSDGYIWFVGRNDDVIKCSGYRIGPFEVESALMTHPSVLECAITAAPDPVRGQVVKATIVLAKGYEPSDALKKELQNHVKKETAPYKYPRIVEFVEELPKTISGKIKRKQIRIDDQNKA
ncbi:AMP-binding protein [Anaerotruncus rubiinfantis]|uniref:AMP-binding protein n=1 Tax=Anaerotruncus rubiinfantis TaxID=1720200 RepID=UPI00189C32AA|nr:AMP-binding protein [Anaerotruncus rubiinfantis]